MKRHGIVRTLLFVSVFGLGLPAITAAAPTAEAEVPSQAIAQRIASATVPFIVNEGQIDDDSVLYYARTFAGTLFVTADSRLVYALPRPHADADGATAVWAFQESFAGRRVVEPRGGETSAVRASSFKGDDPSNWKRGLETFDSVDLGELYPGIRVTLKAAAHNVEKLFHVAPGADAGAIDIGIDGIEGVSVGADGQLVLATSLGDIAFTEPVAYQIVDDARRSVDVAYVLSDAGHYGFRLGDYDRSRPLVIDPMLASTYLGGHNPNPPGNYDDDIIHGIVSAGGDIYVAGVTQSPDFPIVLGYDDTLPNSYPDGFVARMSGDLSTVVASTYIGTDGFDRVTDMALDVDGTIIVVGQAGYGFPVTDGAYTWSGTTPTGGGFVARFNPDLSDLLASSVVTPHDYPRQVALAAGGIYFGGSTNSPDFPITPGAFLSTCCPVGSFGIREYDGFAGEISSDLSTLMAMTYLGGNTVSGISAAPDGTVYITDGFDYAVTGYIARFDSGLTTRSSYLSYYPGSSSGSSRTYFNDVVAGDGYVVTAGQTYMNDLPATDGAYDTTCGTDGLCDGVGPLLVPRSDGFVAKYSADLSTTLALTYLGGSYHEAIRSLALGADGGIFVVGETISDDFPTFGEGADTTCGVDGQCDPTGPYGTPTADGFMVRFTSDLSSLGYGTYLGGSGEELPQAIALDPSGLVYTAGYTRSADFPTTDGAFDTTYNGGTSDAFITLIDSGAGSGAGAVIFADGFESGGMSVWSDVLD